MTMYMRQGLTAGDAVSLTTATVQGVSKLSARYSRKTRKVQS